MQAKFEWRIGSEKHVQPNHKFPYINYGVME